MKHSTPANSLI